MPNGETIEVMNAIAAVHTDLLHELGTVKESIAKLSTLKDKVDDLEEEQKSARNRQYWHSALILPLITAVHAILNHLGIKV